MSSQTPQPFTPQAFETTFVTIHTRDFRVEGTLYIPKTGKDDRRLTNLLNSDRKFLAISNASVTDMRDPNNFATQYPFLQLNIDTIELIIPSGES
jgi:hypothetical protein